MSAEFKVGDTVRVLRPRYRNDKDSAPEGTVVKIAYTYPDEFCNRDEVLLEGWNTYSHISDIVLWEEDTFTCGNSSVVGNIRSDDALHWYVKPNDGSSYVALRKEEWVRVIVEPDWAVKGRILQALGGWYERELTYYLYVGGEKPWKCLHPNPASGDNSLTTLKIIEKVYTHIKPLYTVEELGK